ncbi:hypothetical protein F4561_005659 [Lipingzhangella halophila]|uniref:UTRA domain-containing protein n=1 Tax=Lipingzhangella halophila TaxID=1783352 RepID=A0A7W7RML1_9ACTN|nr:UTRA domain-containing protein [Lipingzhangella halophila]MBB4934765.1 hypothetical protein [Lipingzhangella halophila]
MHPDADTTETRQPPPENAAVALNAAPEQELTTRSATITGDHGVVALRTTYTTDTGPIPEPTEATTQTYARPLNHAEAAQLQAPPGVVALVQDETAYRHGRATAFTTTVYRSDAISLTDHYTPHPAHT